MYIIWMQVQHHYQDTHPNNNLHCVWSEISHTIVLTVMGEVLQTCCMDLLSYFIKIINQFPEALSIFVTSHRMVYWISPMAQADIMHQHSHLREDRKKKRKQCSTGCFYRWCMKRTWTRKLFKWLNDASKEQSVSRYRDINTTDESRDRESVIARKYLFYFITAIYKQRTMIEIHDENN